MPSILFRPKPKVEKTPAAPKASPLWVLAQQRYAKSHRSLANCRGVKDFRRFRNSQGGTWFSRSVWGLDSDRILKLVLRENILSKETQMPQAAADPWAIACSNSSRLAGSSKAKRI